MTIQKSKQKQDQDSSTQEKVVVQEKQEVHDSNKTQENQNIKKKYIKINITELKEYERNNKIHTDESTGALKSAIDRNGYLTNIEVDENNLILSGHGRLKALKEKGITEVEVTKIIGLTEKQKKDHRLSSNVVATLSQDNLENIKIELDDIGNAELASYYGIELEDIGYDQETEDEVPEIKEDEEIFIKKGDLFELGNHRLLCGDSTKKEDYDKLMNGEIADLIFTDPPYNIDYEGSNGLKIQNDKMERSQFYKFLYDFYKASFEVTKKGGCIYVCHGEIEGVNFRKAFQDSGWDLKQCIIWNKNNSVLSRQDYNWKHEPILYGWKPGNAHFFVGDFTQTTVQDQEEIDYKELNKKELIELIEELRRQIPTTVVDQDMTRINDVHPTMKPIGLVETFLVNSSRGGENILDPFGGSGSTLIASEKINRKCFTIEIDEKYVQVIIKRYYEYTKGKRPIKCLNRSFDINQILKSD